MEPRHPITTINEPMRDRSSLNGRRLFDPRHSGNELRDLGPLTVTDALGPLDNVADRPSPQNTQPPPLRPADRSTHDMHAPVGATPPHMPHIDQLPDHRGSTRMAATNQETMGHNVDVWAINSYSHDLEASHSGFRSLQETPNVQTNREATQGTSKRRPGRPRGSKTLAAVNRTLSKFNPNRAGSPKRKVASGTPQGVDVDQTKQPNASIPGTALTGSLTAFRRGAVDFGVREHWAPPLQMSRSLPPFSSDPQAQQGWGFGMPGSLPGYGPPSNPYQYDPHHPYQHERGSRLSYDYASATVAAASEALSRNSQSSYPTCLIAILIDDKRFGYADPQIAEFRVPVHVVEGGGYWADAQDICEQLQRGPSRIDGPARVYCFRGKFRQIFLRVSANNEDNYVSTNLHISDGRTLEIFVDSDFVQPKRTGHISRPSESLIGDTEISAPVSRASSSLSTISKSASDAGGRGKRRASPVAPAPSRLETSAFLTIPGQQDSASVSQGQSPASSASPSDSSNGWSQPDAEQPARASSMPPRPLKKLKRDRGETGADTKESC